MERNLYICERERASLCIRINKSRKIYCDILCSKCLLPLIFKIMFGRETKLRYIHIIIRTIFYTVQQQQEQRMRCTHPFICIYSSHHSHDCRHCTRFSTAVLFTGFHFARTQPIVHVLRSFFFLSRLLSSSSLTRISCALMNQQQRVGITFLSIDELHSQNERNGIHLALLRTENFE